MKVIFSTGKYTRGWECRDMDGDLGPCGDMCEHRESLTNMTTEGRS